MATATATFTLLAHPNGSDNTLRRQILYGTVALSGGGTYAPGGIPLVWNFVNPDGSQFIPNTSKSQPLVAFFFSTAGGQYNYGFNPTLNTMTIGSGGAQLANLAAITADTIGFEAEYAHNV